MEPKYTRCEQSLWHDYGLSIRLDRPLYYWRISPPTPSATFIFIVILIFNHHFCSSLQRLTMEVPSALLMVCLALVGISSGSPTTDSHASATKMSSTSTKHSTTASTKTLSSWSQRMTSSSKIVSPSATSVATTFDLNVSIPSFRIIVYSFANISHSSMSAPSIPHSPR